MTCRCGTPLQNVAIESPNIVCMTCFRENLRGFDGARNSFRELPRLRLVPLLDGFVASEYQAAA